jgi:SnoaL-like domain
VAAPGYARYTDAKNMSREQDIEAIRVVMARYFRFIDTKQWLSLRQIFADDISMAAPDDLEGAQPLIGADRVVRMIERVLGPSVSVHRGYLTEIELAGPNEASAIWAMEDLVEFIDRPDRNFRGQGHYHVGYFRASDGWKIASLTLRRLRLDRG